MTLLSILTACLSLLIAVVGYFIKRHIERTEAKIDKMRNELTAARQDIIWISNSVKEVREITSDSSASQVSNSQKLINKLNQISQETYENKVKLLEHERHLSNYGKVIRKYLIDKK